MPLPLIPIVIAAAFGAIGGVIVALNWDKIVIRLSGKRLAILGERQVGKTTLIKFLTEGWIPEQYEQTLGTTRYKGRRFQLKDLDLKIKQSKDVAGSEASYAEWKAVVQQADIVFYLIRVDRLQTGDPQTQRRVRQDMEHIRDWLRGTGKTIAIIGTHADLDPEFTTARSKNDIATYYDSFRKLPVVQDLNRLSGGTATIVIGSLLKFEDAQRLVHLLFQQLI